MRSADRSKVPADRSRAARGRSGLPVVAPSARSQDAPSVAGPCCSPGPSVPERLLGLLELVGVDLAASEAHLQHPLRRATASGRVG